MTWDGGAEGGAAVGVDREVHELGDLLGVHEYAGIPSVFADLDDEVRPAGKHAGV